MARYRSVPRFSFMDFARIVGSSDAAIGSYSNYIAGKGLDFSLCMLQSD